MNWQTLISILIVGLAAGWAVRLLVVPFIQSLKQPQKDGHCGGGCCGCGEQKNVK